MKKIYLVFITIFTIGINAFAQQNMQDVIYLKNGNIVKGVIIEQVPNQYLKVETPDKSIFVFKVEEIDKIDKEALPKVQKPLAQTVYTRPTPIQAQDKKFYSGFSFGVGLGMCTNAGGFINDMELALNSEDIVVDLKEKPLLGINLGLAFGYKIKKWMHIQAEINYMNKGFSYSGDGFMYVQQDYWAPVTRYDVTLKQKHHMNYIQIPVVMKFVCKPGLYLSVGPAIEIATQASLKVSVEVNGTPDSQREVLKGYMNTFNAGAVVGAGFQKKWFGMEVRYLYDFMDSYTADVDDHHLKNQLYQFSLYFYPGKQ